SKAPAEVLYALPALMGVTAISCGSVAVAKKLKKENPKKLAIVTGTAATGLAATGALVLPIKPGTQQTIGGDDGVVPFGMGDTATGAVGALAVDNIETVVTAILGVIGSKLLSGIGADSPIHLFGIPEVTEEGQQDLSKKYSNAIELPFGLWECRLTSSELDFSALPMAERPTEVHAPSTMVLAGWRKYAMCGREFEIPEKASTIPIPTPVGPFFVKIDLSVKLELERQFSERIAHNSFGYVASIFDGLQHRKGDREQRPAAATGDEIWATFVNDHQRNLFLLCLYAGCDDMGYLNTVGGNVYGSRPYYEVYIDERKGVAGAAAFRAECKKMYATCIRLKPDLESPLRRKTLSLRQVDALMDAAGSHRIVALRHLSDYLQGKAAAKKAKELEHWHRSDKTGQPFHFTLQPVKLIRRIARYNAAQGERQMHGLREKIDAHKGHDRVRNAFSSAFDVLDAKKEIRSLNAASRKELGIGQGVMTSQEMSRMKLFAGGAKAALHKIHIVKAFQGDNYLHLVSQRIAEAAKASPSPAERREILAAGQVKSIRSGRSGTPEILGNHLGSKKTSGMWSRTEFYNQSGKQGSDLFAKRRANLVAIDEKVDAYHSIAWTPDNLDERIACLNEIIALVNAYITERPKSKRKAGLLKLTEQACDEIGLFESARS
ncbi:MAG: hypothetical protein VX405_11995, partial [Myxococcota bacterium]|nr:hypothetical protein [Myxococcota bacterium]